MSTKWTFICNIENLSKVTLWVSFEPYRSAFMCLLFWCIIFSANFLFLHSSAVHFQKRKATQHIKYFPLLGILRNSSSRSKGGCICSGVPSSWNDFHSCMRSLLIFKVGCATSNFMSLNIVIPLFQFCPLALAHHLLLPQNSSVSKQSSSSSFFYFGCIHSKSTTATEADKVVGAMVVASREGQNKTHCWVASAAVLHWWQIAKTCDLQSPEKSAAIVTAAAAGLMYRKHRVCQIWFELGLRVLCVLHSCLPFQVET